MGACLDLILLGEDATLLTRVADAAYAKMARPEQMMSRYRNTSAPNAINLAADLQYRYQMKYCTC